MFGSLQAFFTKRRAEKQERVDEEYSTMTTGEREIVQGGVSGAVDEYYGRQAGRINDGLGGRPPRP
jgi:hypothetical protein